MQCKLSAIRNLPPLSRFHGWRPGPRGSSQRHLGITQGQVSPLACDPIAPRELMVRSLGLERQLHNDLPPAVEWVDTASNPLATYIFNYKSFGASSDAQAHKSRLQMSANLRSKGIDAEKNQIIISGTSCFRLDPRRDSPQASSSLQQGRQVRQGRQARLTRLRNDVEEEEEEDGVEVAMAERQTKRARTDDSKDTSEDSESAEADEGSCEVSEA